MRAAPFKDHFSSLAEGYRRHRPRYPEALFSALAEYAPRRRLAWDVGCGSGQASLGLAEHFARVIATDAASAQIAKATPHPRVAYKVALAEASGIAPASVDLVLIAQALHWFDLDAFYGEVTRVAAPGAVVAAVAYQLFTIAPDIDAVVQAFYAETLGPYWPPERRFIDDGYTSIAFPFAALAPPAIVMTAQWSLAEVLGYLATWSAVAAYRRARGEDPIPAFAPRLARLWGAPGARRAVRWPLCLRLGRVG
ncbi:MAG: class I SAM-dependent methyltransferase [Pseudomonadota bacterium]